jgi:hypothetical protein
MTRLLVCGGRHYQDREFLFSVLDALQAVRSLSCVIHGAASGADQLAGEWAKLRGVQEDPYPVSRQDWATLGRAAGPIRNERMLVNGRPDICIAFPGGKGTDDICWRIRSAGIALVRYP